MTWPPPGTVLIQGAVPVPRSTGSQSRPGWNGKLSVHQDPSCTLSDYNGDLLIWPNVPDGDHNDIVGSIYAALTLARASYQSMRNILREFGNYREKLGVRLMTMVDGAPDVPLPPGVQI